MSGKWRKVQDLDKFKEFIDNNIDKTVAELSMHWSEKISKSSILNYIKLIGYS